MGTRGLLGFRHRGIRKASYNHYDSYPEGLGTKIIQFILSLSAADRAKMIGQIETLTWVDLKSTPDEASVERYTKLGYVGDESLGREPAEDWYMLLHRMQGAPCLPAILKGDLLHLIDDSVFVEDAMFCEWGYYIDFEEGELEVWKDTRMLWCFEFEALATTDLEAVRGKWEKEEEGKIERGIAGVDLYDG